MSKLKNRLNRLKKTHASSDINEKDQVTSSQPSEVEEWGGVGAVTETTSYGSFIKRLIKIPFHKKVGFYPLSQLVDKAEVLCHLQASESNIQHDKMLFFDTETTGLGIGTGNVPFMLGIGYYTKEEFVVEQLFIRNPSEELAMLTYMNEKFQQFTHLVSYNGKTFDLPLLKNRFVLHRKTYEGEHLEHLDLLYPARSLWRNTLTTCKLSYVEHQRLGIHRVDDVPGSMAPTLYFKYLSEKDPNIMADVFRHNEIDIVTLAVLSIYFTTLFEDTELYKSIELDELYRLCLWFNKMELTDQFQQVYELLIKRATEEDPNYFIPLAMIFKKKKEVETSVFLWREFIELQGHQRMINTEPYIELAKYYEHRKKDFEKAIYYTKEAEQRVYQRISFSRRDNKYVETIKEIQKRKTRLERKWMNKQEKREKMDDVSHPKQIQINI
ncbi:ribonuclease H-like domain-containing protein [Chengkuizengella axinellae]|uniref:Ribonuclease H-like domain-containing protein n=1 Tax=Chengkuizengella axinellae TaxID=3064388 RepID=A0ABT9IXI4_9BACL|nr:ribonuclease H-like domain-containing protein [Chengkuizengella sp. 2205SS18-9]MDP5274074.1 ribonuclease H-like domain-containing protein [Chengkuizengella sp. 2205SS18-9]